MAEDLPGLDFLTQDHPLDLQEDEPGPLEIRRAGGFLDLPPSDVPVLRSRLLDEALRSAVTLFLSAHGRDDIRLGHRCQVHLRSPLLFGGSPGSPGFFYIVTGSIG